MDKFIQKIFGLLVFILILGFTFLNNENVNGQGDTTTTYCPNSGELCQFTWEGEEIDDFKGEDDPHIIIEYH